MRYEHSLRDLYVMNSAPMLIQNRKIIALTGRDRFDYLQGLITNDVMLCKSGAPIYTAMLTSNGRFLYDFFVIPQESVLYLTVPKVLLTECLKKFRMHKLRADVNITSSQINLYHAHTQMHDSSFPDPRLEKIGYFTLSQHLYHACNNDRSYHMKRYKYCIPDYGDMVPEKSIILEYGFEFLNGISWTKGCYMGQELMARTRHQGLIRKRSVIIKHLDEESTLLKVGDALFLGEEKIGKIVGAQGHIGMGLVRLYESGLNINSRITAKTTSGSAVSIEVPNW